MERGARRASEKACAPKEEVLKMWAEEWFIQRGREGRLGKALAAQRLAGTAEEVGGATHVFLDGSEQEDELRDYERLTESSEAFSSTWR
jgi:hypothetical protein